MLLAGWEVRIVKRRDRGLKNSARGHKPRTAFSSPRSQSFTIRTDPKPKNNVFNFFSALKSLTSGFFTQHFHLIGFRAVYKPLQKIYRESERLTQILRDKERCAERTDFSVELPYVSCITS